MVYSWYAICSSSPSNMLFGDFLYVTVVGTSGSMGTVNVNALRTGALTFLGITSDMGDIVRRTFEDNSNSDDVGIDNIAFGQAQSPHWMDGNKLVATRYRRRFLLHGSLA